MSMSETVSSFVEEYKKIIEHAKHLFRIVNVRSVLLGWVIISNGFPNRLAWHTHRLMTRLKTVEELTWLLSLVELDELGRFH